MRTVHNCAHSIQTLIVFSLVPTVEWDVGEVLKSQWNLVHSRIGLRWNNDRHEPSSRLYSRYHRSTIQLPELTAGLWEEAGLEGKFWVRFSFLIFQKSSWMVF